MAADPYQIKTAVVGDIPELTGLLSELFSREEEFSPDKHKQSEGLEKIITGPEAGIIYTARHSVSGRICGMVSLLYTISTALGGRAAVLEDMIVGSESRREGVGSLLLEKAFEHCRETGILRLTLLTDPGNKTAESFYKKNGFSNSDMRVMRMFL